MKFIIKPIICDYAVIKGGTGEIMCICNIRRNAELIADILNADNDNVCAYSYDIYPYAKYKVVKAKSEEELDTSKRPNYCPLIEIKESDDCISRQEFLKRIIPYNTSDPHDRALYNFAFNKMMQCASVKAESKDT